MGSNLRHSHVGIQYWKWVEYIFISPAQHQLHHSIAKEHHDKNFGAALAIWDWLFGSLHHSVDFETLEDDSVTIRDRDSMNQERVLIKDLNQFYQKYFH